jgi:hypothetical protein
MRRSTILLALGALLLSGTAFAEDPSLTDLFLEEEVDEAYEFPKIKTDANLRTGFHFTDVDGSNQVAPYEYLEDSVLFGGDLRYTSFPHRLHFDFDYRNEKDYFGDAWYSYKDTFYMRAINSTFFHNLPNIDLDPLQAGAGVDVRDTGETYGLKTGISRLYLRGKTPDFPLHVYVDNLLVTKSGDRQQRGLLGAAWFSNLEKSSQRRDVDFETRVVRPGINSHVGPVEIDYSHAEKRFDVAGDDVLYDAYDASGMRAAGVYPHNLIPEVKSSVDTLKVHTSHTGKIVAAATLQRTNHKNEDSGAKSEYIIGAGGVTLMPMPRLTFFLKYRHKKIDNDNPSTVTLTDRMDPTNSYTYSVRPSISSTTNRASVSARYRPLSGLTLKSGYHYMEIDRKDAAEWGVPKSSQRHTAQISARARIANSLQAKAEYIRREFDDPAYNTDPDSSNEARISLTWLPTPRLSTLLSYDMTRESRDDLHFADTEEPDDRDVRKEFVMGSMTYQILQNLSVTSSYAYINYRVEQDIEYHDSGGVSHTDEDVTSKNKAHSYALDIHYVPHERIALSTGINHTIGRSSFSPNAAALLEPEPVSIYSKMRTEETEYNASCDLKLGNNYSSSISYRYAKLDDDIENLYDDIEDGDYHSILITLSKSW